MPPDLNSLPPSPTLGRSSMAETAPSPSPHSPSLSSLQAAAAINAGMRNSNSPRQSRRRSSLMTNLHLNDASLPAPGELATSDPHHHRAPSLGQIHQELENEQEAQVNRLLHMIRVQQDQIDSLHTGDSTREGDVSTSSSSQQQQQHQHQHQQRPASLSRHSSQAISVTSGPRSSSRSPALRPVASPYESQRGDDWLGRDESAFYQAETQMLTRENQMLKARIRELERQLASTDNSPHHAPPPASSHSPAIISPLASPPVVPDLQQPNPSQQLY